MGRIFSFRISYKLATTDISEALFFITLLVAVLASAIIVFRSSIRHSGQDLPISSDLIRLLEFVDPSAAPPAKEEKTDIPGLVPIPFSKAALSAPVEQQRTKFAERAKKFLKDGDFYSTLQHCDKALSSKYTKPTSPKSPTAKCHFMRAKALLRLGQFAEAQTAFNDFERIQVYLEEALDRSEEKMKADINSRVPSAKSPRKNTERLFKAVMARGVIVPQRDIAKFTAVSFDSKVLAGEAPRLKYTIWAETPFFTKPDSEEKHKVEVVYRENLTVEGGIGKMFRRFGIKATDLDDRAMRLYMFEALAHEDARTSTVVIRTHRGRLLAIPHTTQMKDIVAGARWPREGPMPFRDLTRTPRRNPYEVDGVEVVFGRAIVLNIVTKDRLREYIMSHS
ncbi:unnamed protein product [Somion occarium]|uniref:Tetratricopeptide repeat protein n=1 Tax=Somion occarium TaxID=3059160 RepID=A0ABP1DSS6_9APHY